MHRITSIGNCLEHCFPFLGIICPFNHIYCTTFGIFSRDFYYNLTFASDTYSSCTFFLFYPHMPVLCHRTTHKKVDNLLSWPFLRLLYSNIRHLGNNRQSSISGSQFYLCLNIVLVVVLHQPLQDVQKKLLRIAINKLKVG